MHTSRLFSLRNSLLNYTMLRRGSIVNEKCLAVFDFDKTIVHGDSYELVGGLLPENGQPTGKTDASKPWLEYINEVLVKLQTEQHMTAESIVQKVSDMVPLPGMNMLIHQLAAHTNIEMCIMSDSNSSFINGWLSENIVQNTFNHVVTNPAKLSDDPRPRMVIHPFHQQTDCKRCPKNLCKGKVLKDMMNANPNQSGDGSSNAYKLVVYFGDSLNDLCPIFCLREQDVACIRRDEELHRNLSLHERYISCRIIIWGDGYELQDKLFPDVFPNRVE